MALSALPGSAATFTVTQNVWGTDSTAGTFAWAMHQADTTPGFDTISLTSNVSIDDYLEAHHPFRLADITDLAGLRIQGNGHSLIGNPSFINPQGVVHTKTNPQRFTPPGDVLLVKTYSFAKISDYVSKVEINNLIVDGLNSFLNIGKDTIVTVRDSVIRNMGDFGQRPAPVIEVNEGSTLNLQRVAISHINNFQKNPFPTVEYLWYPAIVGAAATLNMERSTLDLLTSATGGGIGWNGGTANVVSSVILGKGLSITDNLVDGVLNVVNSVFRPYNYSAMSRIQAHSGGEANVIASTIQYDATFTSDVHSCPANYTCNGAPLQAFNGGTINLSSTVASVINSDVAQINLPYSDEYGGTQGTLNADAYSFVQPVPNQDSAALKSLFGQANLRTSGDPFALTPNIPPYPPIYVALPTGAEPLKNGPLINIVPDANGANKLINPIDGSVIRTDVYGNTRTSNDLRNIGAVQNNVPGPLPVLGAGAAFGWTRRLRRRIRQTT